MKRVITIVIVIIVAVGLGWYLFKISPQTQTTDTSGYNSAITVNTNVKQISTPPPFDPSTDHYMGDPKAKNVFIEYGDTQCPYCAEYNPMLTQVATAIPDTVFVFRYFPLLQHQNTVEASLAAEAAGAQGKFWEMHDLLFAQQADWENLSDPLSLFQQYAQQIGVKDINQFTSDITSKKYLSVLQTGEDQAYALQLQGTPSYFYNGHPLALAPDMATLKQEAAQYANK